MVPTMIFAIQQTLELLERQQQHRWHFPGMVLILIGGQSASSALIDFLRERCYNARIVQTYACTEAASSLTFWQVHPPLPLPPFSDHSLPCNQSSSDEQHDGKLSGDCVGVPPNHVQIFLLEPNPAPSSSSSSLILGQQLQFSPFIPGIIATRGPHVMNGHWQRGEQDGGSCTAFYTSHRPGGYLVTNDLGYRDEHGRLFFCGRVQDSIRTGGETVLSSEVEKCLQQHPDIAQCAVFSFPDDRFGELVCCAVVLSTAATTLCNLMPPTSSTREKGSRIPATNVSAMTDLTQELRTWCESQGLASYKRPRGCLVVDALPKNSSGKVLKFRLQEMMQDWTSPQKPHPQHCSRL